MTSEYDRNGKLCTRIMVGEKSFLVDRTTAQILDDTLKYISFDLRGAVTGAKFILGNRNMCPIIVNPYQGICLFPNKSSSKEDCIWFNPEHIVDTKAFGMQTEVTFSNGHSIIVDQKLTHFNNKMQIAIQLKRISVERGNNPGPISFYHEPKKGHRFTKGKTGKYNFYILDNEKDIS